MHCTAAYLTLLPRARLGSCLIVHALLLLTDWDLLLQTVRPLCAGVFKAFSERGQSDTVGNAMAHLLEESSKLRTNYFLPGVHTDVKSLDQETRTMVLKRMQTLGQLASVHSIGGGPSYGTEAQKAAVLSLGDALLRAQQQTYR